MATGGIFQLITNDGKQDKMLMASDLLRNRLAAIQQSRAANSQIADSTPTLLDIEKTHILFTNAHFKPFAAIGYEYNKTNASSGNAALGSDVTFSIPQFGDFFHDMILHVIMKQPQLTATASALSDQPLMRWCSYPGERLCESVEFDVNGNPLDKYYSNCVNFHREFSIQPNKILGWERCVGMEQPEEGFLDQPNWVNSEVAPSSITYRTLVQTASGIQTPTGQKDLTAAGNVELFVPLLFWCNKDVRLAVPSVAIPYGQRFITVHLTNPNNLVNLVPRGANAALGASGWQDANVGGTLNYDGMLQTIELYINNIFVNPEVHNIFIKRIGFSLIRVHRVQTLSANTASAEVLLQQLKWPIETLFVGMRLADYASADTALTRQHLDKWHTFSKVTPAARANQGWRVGKVIKKNAAYALPDSMLNAVLGTTTHNLILSNASAAAVLGTNLFPGINSGDIITLALTSTNTGTVAVGTGQAVSAAVTLTLEVAQVVADDTAVPGYIVFKQLVSDVKSLVGIAGLVTSNVGVKVGTTCYIRRVDSAELSSTVDVPSKTLDAVTITAHGIPIYNNFNTGFYNAYVPYHFGGPNVTVPKDISALMINFCLYPGTYQPSGHINVSRAREFYLSYTSSVISNSVVGQLIVVASAINFLLISDGSAVLRYST